MNKACHPVHKSRSAPLWSQQTAGQLVGSPGKPPSLVDPRRSRAPPRPPRPPFYRRKSIDSPPATCRRWPSPPARAHSADLRSAAPASSRPERKTVPRRDERVIRTDSAGSDSDQPSITLPSGVVRTFKCIGVIRTFGHRAIHSDSAGSSSTSCPVPAMDSPVQPMTVAVRAAERLRPRFARQRERDAAR